MYRVGSQTYPNQNAFDVRRVGLRSSVWLVGSAWRIVQHMFSMENAVGWCCDPDPPASTFGMRLVSSVVLKGGVEPIVDVAP